LVTVMHFRLVHTGLQCIERFMYYCWGLEVTIWPSFLLKRNSVFERPVCVFHAKWLSNHKTVLSKKSRWKGCLFLWQNWPSESLIA